MNRSEQTSPVNFIRNIVEDDLNSGRLNRVVTRFPPEPNGYLHIGHAKSICLNFGLARDYTKAGDEVRCNLRFDDTNPIKEELEYVAAIREDVRWLGFDWGENEYFASDYFEQLYQWAVQLVRAGKAYVDDQDAEQIRANRGTLTEPGKESPWRDRSVEENLDLLEKMRHGVYADGEKVLRARIDMAAPNINLRDPVMYRILHTPHHRTGDTWCIYPMYDFAHGQSDSIEGVTHSICTLEFEDHRPLYDWFCEALNIHHPRQIEFARLNLSYTVLSKRKLLQLVREDRVSGWDDPRMPTLQGYRRRGYTPSAIRSFCDLIGVGKAESRIDVGVLEQCLRDDLDRIAPRRMAVLNPLKLIITNYPEDREEEFEAANHPKDPSMGTRKVPFSRELYIERDDFMEEPPKKFFRLAPGREVRLRFAYFITCNEVIRNEAGEITELHCTYDPASRGGSASDGRKVKGTIHWVSARHARQAEVRLYDRLFMTENPESSGNFLDDLNPDSLTINRQVRVEPSLLNAEPEESFQFERIGYFVVDRRNSAPEAPVFNRSVGLRDSWDKSRS